MDCARSAGQRTSGASANNEAYRQQRLPKAASPMSCFRPDISRPIQLGWDQTSRDQASYIEREMTTVGHRRPPQRFRRERWVTAKTPDPPYAFVPVAIPRRG